MKKIMLIGGSSVKKFWMLLVMLTLFMTMGMTVQAKDQGENEQSANVFDLLGEEFSERGTDVVAWLSEELGKEENAKLAKDVIAFIREKLEAGELATDQDISNAIKEGEVKFDVSLTEEEKEEILQVAQKIKDLGLDPEKLLSRVEKLFDEAGEDLVEEAEETVKKSFVESVTGFFQDMGTRVKEFFTGIFS